MFNIVELCSPVIPEPFGQHLVIGISHYVFRKFHETSEYFVCFDFLLDLNMIKT